MKFVANIMKNPIDNEYDYVDSKTLENDIIFQDSDLGVIDDNGENISDNVKISFGYKHKDYDDPETLFFYGVCKKYGLYSEIKIDGTKNINELSSIMMEDKLPDASDYFKELKEMIKKSFIKYFDKQKVIITDTNYEVKGYLIQDNKKIGIIEGLYFDIINRLIGLKDITSMVSFNNLKENLKAIIYNNDKEYEIDINVENILNDEKANDYNKHIKCNDIFFRYTFFNDCIKIKKDINIPKELTLLKEKDFYNDNDEFIQSRLNIILEAEDNDNISEIDFNEYDDLF